MTVTGETVTVLRYTTNRYGDRVLDAQHTIDRCAFAPDLTRYTSEDVDRSSHTTADALLFCPVGSDITAADVVQLASGQQWEVTGQPEDWYSPWDGWQPGMQVYLRRMTG